LKPTSDRWVTGDAYESFMGRWSRQAAGHFLDWLALTPGLNWLDFGCGTGALSSAICRRARPNSLAGCDLSPDFVSFAHNHVLDCPATFVVASSDTLPAREGGFDVIVSGLVLNFLPEPLAAVQAMGERLRPGGTVAAYVWDYEEGMQFLRIFWQEAAALDPSAADLDEARRFPLCQPDHLIHLWRQAGLHEVAATSLQIATVFRNFDDLWSPFLAGTGPAPSYVASLDAGSQNQLSERLKQRLPAAPDGSISLTARAFGVRGTRAN
jgi:trans-aconitate methyltransferase